MLVPPRRWWKPLGKSERNWVIIAFIWCVMLSAMMPLWLLFGKQNVPATTFRVTPEEFQAQVDDFVAEYQIGEGEGFYGPVPIVAPPAGGNAYLLGRQWEWYPILQLEKDQTYRIHVSSMDVLHGLSIQPTNLTFEILPGYDYVITLTPTESGEFTLVCNEYCFLGHHLMAGRLIVTD